MYDMESIEVTEKLAKLRLKAIFFDMDGVLFDSMPHHAGAWVAAFKSVGIDFNEYEAYMREGMTGVATIQEMYQAAFGREATETECEELYRWKCKYFEQMGKAEVMDGVMRVLETVKAAGLDIYIVTGSGQKSLFGKLDSCFPGIFSQDKMVTAFDVKRGKPDPEPYLMALQKGGFQADEAIVIENAPLGVTSSSRAGIFTIAVNTGILRGEELTSRGADLLFGDMHELSSALPEIFRLAAK